METTQPEMQHIPSQQPLKPQRIWWWAGVIVLLVALITAVWFLMQGSDNNTSGNQQAADTATVTVAITNTGFAPADITIKKGATVVWKNEDSVAHDITADMEGPTSPKLNKNDSYSVPFPVTGTFTYHCSIHPEMKGKITIVE